MIKSRPWHASQRSPAPARLGTVGHLAVFLWVLVTVLLVPQHRLPWATLACLVLCAVVYPVSLQRLVRWRWLLMLSLLALPPVFLLGQSDRVILGLSFSSEGLLFASAIAMRFVAMLVAVDGLTAAVDITAIASLLERAGLQGLGFSMGVALNLLPSLRHSATCTWRSLWMRGGFRKKRWRALKYYLVTVAAGALRRAEEIALSAEARAFAPESARPVPLVTGRLDWIITALAPVALLLVCFVR